MVESLDDNVRDIAENLREMLGAANAFPGLPELASTTNVIKEIGRLSLQIASLIHEYAKAPYLGKFSAITGWSKLTASWWSRISGRVLRNQLSNDMKTRIEGCCKACADLMQKFDRRVEMDTNRQVKGIKDDQLGTMDLSLLIICNDSSILAKEICKWLSAPDSSRNYNAACEQRQENTCAWLRDDEQFFEWQKNPGFLWIKGEGKPVNHISSC